MATQLIDFSIVRDFIYNGVNQGYSCIYLNGTRLWERYQIEEVYQEWVNSGHEEDIYQWQGYQALAHGSSTFLIGPYGYDSEGYINSFAVINWFPTVTSGWVATGQYRLTGHSGNYYGRIREGAERRLSQTQWVDTSIYVDKTKLTDMWYY